MNAISRPTILRHREPTLLRFWRARRDANLALLRWLETHPDPSDIADEVAASISVLRQLVRLAGARP